jgi:hypothetical protein
MTQLRLGVNIDHVAVLFSAILAALSLGAAQSGAAPCTKLDAPGRYVGKIVATTFFGPPNFGEDPAHDQREVYPVLVLDQPLYLCAALDRTEERDAHLVRRMQLIIQVRPYGADWNGKHVSVQGKLFLAETGHHHTPVVLDSTEVAPAPW